MPKDHAAANWSATRWRRASAAPAVATNCRGCKRSASTTAAPRWRENGDTVVAQIHRALIRWMITYAAFARLFSCASSLAAGLRLGFERGSSRAELRIKANSEVT